jgi:hypothetical protein
VGDKKMKLIFAMALLALIALGGSVVQIKSEANSHPTSFPQAGSPTDTIKSYYEAVRMKDVERIKKILSKGTLEMIEAYAKSQNKTIDESMKSGFSDDPDFYETPEMRNEKIQGDKATIEVKNEKTGKWETVPFVKEDDDWKIALDLMFRDAMKAGNTNP